MTAKGDYIVEEVLHLTSYGLDAYYIADALGSNVAAIAKLLRRRGLVKEATIFERARYAA